MDEKKKEPSESDIESSVGDNRDLAKNSKQGYPKSIFFIIGNEFCERFSYYGMKAILVLYFKNVLSYTDDTATEAYHIFAMACYFTPVLGAIIADSLLGKFKTILYISVLYAMGNIILSYASFLTSEAITMLGLASIAFGTGGIKPCVSAFGGDQFGPGQEKQIQKFFSFFYISINAGSLLSTFITPILRQDVSCFGRDDCFPLAFGVPAILMVVALILFIIGKYVTNYRMIPPSKENIVVTTVKCIFTALGRKFFKKTEKRKHWLDYADDKYSPKTIADIKAVMRVLFLYLPLPIFWALFDQTGSRWTLQATRMDGNFFGIYRIKPDQIQVVNPILIILLIPVFEYILYPCIRKANLLSKPLQRITTGGVLAAFSFVVCAFFQLKIEAEIPSEPTEGSAHLAIINGLQCTISVTNQQLFERVEKFFPHEFRDLPDRSIGNLEHTLLINIPVTDQNENCSYSGEYYGYFPAIESKDIAILFLRDIDENSRNVSIEKFSTNKMIEKPENGGSNVKIVFHINDYNFPETNGSFVFQNKEFEKFVIPLYPNYTSFGETDYIELDIAKGGEYKLSLNDATSKTLIRENLPLKQGGSYVMVVYGKENDLMATIDNTVKPNTVSMLWQIVPYIIITAGEIMFSITGLEFSYSQAPISMKSVLQAAWLMTVAFGNLIVAIVATAKIFKRQSYEFFFFAGLMILDMMVFAIMAYFYVPYKEESNEYFNRNVKSKEQQQTEKSYANEGFNEEDTKF